MALRGTKAEDNIKRLKLLLFSPAGVGKTVASIQMPKPYLIDTEGGAVHYGDMISKQDGVVFRTQELSEVEKEVRALMTEKHDFLTVIIDPFTVLYEMELEKGEKEVGTEWGRHYGFANKNCKRLLNLLAMIDMNVIITCHAKDDWSNNDKNSNTKTFDGYKKLDYMMDLVLELQRVGNKRLAKVRKTRLEGFPDTESFEWSFDQLENRYGKEHLFRNVELAVLATSDQVSKLNSLIKNLSIDSTVVDKWLTKAKVDRIEDMQTDGIEKCIKHLTKIAEEAIKS